MMIGKNILLTGTTVILFLMPLIYLFVWRSKTHAHWKALFIGAAGFIVSARVLELIVHYFCIVSDNLVSRAINGSTPLYVLYGVAMAGIFEEVGRWVILSILNKKINQRKDAIMYGIGHGGIEILAVLLPSMILYLVIAVLFSAGNIENALSTLNIAEDTAAAALPSVEAAAAFDYAMMAMNVIERLFALLLHIGLTVIVYYGVVNIKKACLPAAIILHMLMDTFPALYQRGVVALWAVEIWAALWTAVIVFVAVKLYRKMKAQPMNDSV